MMKFSLLAVYLDRLEKTSSRIAITEILAELFKKADKSDIKEVSYLVLGQLGPKYEGKVLSLADKMMLRVAALISRQDIQKVTALYKESGDVGDVFSSLCKDQKGSNISTSEVFAGLNRIASEGGEGSQERKIEQMADLLRRLDPLSAKYTARIPMGKLRLGFSEKTIIDALSWMLGGDKSVKGPIEKAYQVMPDIGQIALEVKTHERSGKLIEPSPKPGIPVEPMLAQRLGSPSEMVKKMGKVGIEPKLDGLRLSIHIYKKEKNGRIIKAFTRNMNETSWMFPELGGIGHDINADEVILDCEAVGLDEKSKQLANFQTTMTRRRKHDIGKVASKTAIRFYVFDILYKDGKNLMSLTYLDRKKILDKTIKKNRVIIPVDYLISDDPKQIEAQYRQKIKAGFEGIMIKKIDAGYIPGRTGWRWVKMKQEESSAGKLVDTVDCVVMGFSRGRGKRVGFGIGQFLVGVKDRGIFKTTSKIGTGLTDAQFRELNSRLEKLKTDQKPASYQVDKIYTPDYWVTPSLVVEIAADEITKSPTHTAGLALRFPRLIRLRDDKNPDQATTASELSSFYKLQK